MGMPQGERYEYATQIFWHIPSLRPHDAGRTLKRPGVGIGLYILLDYEMTPGPGGEAPEVWPA